MVNNVLIMDYFELECAVEDWAEKNGIFTGCAMSQALKTLEESVELGNAVYRTTHYNEDTTEIVDAIGDIIVTLIIQARMWDVTLEECLESAYKVIENRTGKMVNGQFVKD